ncbi:MAG: hypothetical protein HY875_09610 [Chloroflexi bacterium]|nr:hypothetical protein [Chloroflexota bacterium]
MPRLLAVAAVAVLLLAACGSDKAPADNGVSDEEYLRVLCTGLDNYSDSLLGAAKPDQIAKVVQDYITAMKAVTPPKDLAPFHTAFITYLEQGFADPKALLTVSPPRPPEKVASRLVAKEPQVPECQDATFFGRK